MYGNLSIPDWPSEEMMFLEEVKRHTYSKAVKKYLVSLVRLMSTSVTSAMSSSRRGTGSNSSTLLLYI
jgi:hypothetical protein